MSKPIWIRLRSVLDRDADATSVELSRESAEEMLAEIKRLTAEVEKLNSELTDALTDLNTARQDNASFGPELKRLTAENEKLRAALESIADLPPGYADMRQDDLVVILAKKARAALEEKQ